MKKTLLTLIPACITLFCLLGSISSCTYGKAETIDRSAALMGSGYGISSTTLLVQDLDSTQRYFTEVLGFSIRETKEFQAGDFEGSIVSTITFPNMSSIQLLSVEDSIVVTGKGSLIRNFLDQYEGIGMYSLSTSSADSTHGWLSAQGFEMDSVSSYSIPDSSPPSSAWEEQDDLVFTAGFANRGLPKHLPEFVEFATFPYERMHEWNSFYNMSRQFSMHPNGALGITAIKVVVEDLAVAREEIQKMGLTELEEDPAENLARFQLKRNQELHIITPQSPDDALAGFLEQRGSGVFAIVFEVKDLTATHDLLKENLPSDALLQDSVPNRLTVLEEYAHGVQLEFIEESAEQALLAQKLTLNFGAKLDSVAQEHAAGLYLKYCALCHGENREGYAADFSPSLRSHSLMATSQSSNFLRYTIQYGRANTAMAGYYDERGGPMEFLEIELLLKWLYEESGVEEPIELSREPVVGDVELGSILYAEKCTACHGAKGEGISAPALGNPMLLATATDEFLRYAIAEGRDSTLMPAFKDSLNKVEIDALTAFLRSRASGWEVPKGDTVSIPTPEDYVLNPDRNDPDFELREGLYLSAEQLNKALQDSMRLIVLDARSEVAWRQTHIPGAIPVPYYEEPEDFVEDIPNDSTWIVAYCACPHAASGEVISKLREYGFKKTAILDEGILVWAQLGYPVRHGN